MKRVAIIGAGAAGLCALRHLTRMPEVLRVSAYEQTSEVGGTWVYRPSCDEHSSMYRNLRTNIPKEVMAFPDFPFSPALSSFPGHEDVRRYLEEYAKHYHLLRSITFNCQVINVSPLPAPDDRDKRECCWQLTLRTIGRSDSREWTDTFDAVIVCNGHYFEPIIPMVTGLENFTGQIMHSHDYREPEIFAGQTVLIVGCGASGQDLTIDIAEQAKNVIISARQDKRLQCPLPSNVTLRTAIVAIQEDGSVLFDDGTCANVDGIVWCTGYSFSYPFLASDCGVTVELSRRVRPLYKHLFHCERPSMAFMGIPYLVAPFPLFDRQAQLLLAVLMGKVDLPGTTEMLEWEHSDYLQRLDEGMKPHYAHVLSDKQWAYASDLAAMAGIDDLPSFMSVLYHRVHLRRRTTLMDYRRESYTILNSEEFRIHPGDC